MQALILAAGMGSRLGALTKNDTKCMLPINGKRLIDRTITLLEKFGITRVIVVVGFGSERLIEHLGASFRNIEFVYVENPKYDETNNIYSLYLADKYLKEDDTLLLESDLIFDESLLQKILDDKRPDLVAVDNYESWMDGTCVVCDNSHIIDFVDKNKFDFERTKDYLKTVNIYKFSRTFYAQYYSNLLKAYIEINGVNEYYEAVINTLTGFKENPLQTININGSTWYEVDDVADLAIANTLFERDISKKYDMVMSTYGGYWRYPSLIDFCYLVNPYFPSKKMLDEMRFNFQKTCSHYPSSSNVQALLAAKLFGLENVENIVLTNGGAEIIKVLPHILSGTLGTYTPTFNEYVNVFGERAVIQENMKDNFQLGLSDYIKLAEECDNLLLVNPENPTGNFMSYENVIELLDYCLINKKTVIVDESFVDFVDPLLRFTLVSDEILKKYPNLMVIKSISKSYGVAGLRLGIICSGNTKVLSLINKYLPIWNINSIGENFMQIIGKYKKDYLLSCEKLSNERKRFKKSLEEISFLRVYESQSNYFLIELLNGYKSLDLAFYLLEHNILVKDVSSKISREGAFLRIAIRSQEDNDYLYKCLKQFLRVDH